MQAKRVEAAKARRDVVAAQLRQIVREAMIRLNAAERHVRLIESTVLPQIEHAFELTRLAYAAGEGPFTDILDTRRTLLSTQLDLALWVVLGLLGVLLVVHARRVAHDLEGRATGPDPTRLRRQLKTALITAGSLHALVWLMGWPWPHRFSASVVLLLTLAWVASTPGGAGHWLRGLAIGLMPETGGRGLWSGRARRRILERLVAAGDASRLLGADTRLTVTALSIGTGRLVHFVSWPDPDPAYVALLEAEQG